MGLKVYNRAFKAGVGLNVTVFVILNAISFVVEKRKYDSSPIKISHSRIDWGFPFAWTWDTGIGLGFMLNVAVIAISSFVVGFLFRYFLGRENQAE